jgi:DNA (cytosine-5)-methyltransferase 1
MRPRAVDLFSGARGWDVFDSELGIESVGVDSNLAANMTARAAGFLAVDADVRHLSPVGCGFVGGKKSPPCQTFSTAGKGAGRQALESVYAAIDHLYQTGSLDYEHFSDVRTGLVLEPLRWALDLVRAGQPYRWLVLEQVPPVLPVWERVGKVLEAVGYSVISGNLRAEQFGCATTRSRAILIARLDGEARMPVPTHSRYHSRTPDKLDQDVLPWVSIRDVLGDVPPFLSSNTMANGTTRPATAPAQTLAFGNDVASFVFHHGERSIREAKAAGRVRQISVEEAALLQSFPGGYPWRGSAADQYLQISNAIPPLLAKAILETVIR